MLSFRSEKRQVDRRKKMRRQLLSLWLEELAFEKLKNISRSSEINR